MTDYSNESVNLLHIRFGSEGTSSGVVVQNSAISIVHPNYNSLTADSDIAVLHSATNFVFNNNANSVPIANVDYNLPDNAPVSAIGLERLSYSAQLSDTLRQVKIWTVNRITYGTLGYIIAGNMLCAGWRSWPMRWRYWQFFHSWHFNTTVGVYSWSYQCSLRGTRDLTLLFLGSPTG